MSDTTEISLIPGTTSLSTIFQKADGIDAILTQMENAARARAEREKLEAIEAERQRVAQLKVQADAEKAEREANLAHRSNVNNAAKTAFMAQAGLTEEQAKAAVVAIAKGQINHVSIGY